MSLEDFHTKAMRLVTQAGYEGDAKDQVLRDTIDRLLFGVFSRLVCMRYCCTLHQTLYAWLMRGVWYWCGLESLIIGSYIYHSDVIAGTHAMLLI